LRAAAHLIVAAARLDDLERALCRTVERFDSEQDDRVGQ